MKEEREIIGWAYNKKIGKPFPIYSNVESKDESKKDRELSNTEKVQKELNEEDEFVKKVTLRTQAYHKLMLEEFNKPKYPDGTYNVSTKKPVEYAKGFQVTFCQLGDDYSAEEYMARCKEFLKVSSDGVTSAGKFEGYPEISFHCNDKATAIRLAKKYNQISIWDWEACDVIPTGGTGRR